MGIMKKLVSSGVAARVVAEARKPENQAKAKAAVRKLQEKRRGRSTR